MCNGEGELTTMAAKKLPARSRLSVPFCNHDVLVTQYRIFTLLLLIASFAVGWWVRGFVVDTPAAMELRRDQDAKQVDYVLASSVWINRLIEESRGDPEERAIRFRNHLVLQIYDLARFEQLHTGNAHDIFLMHGSHSLQHLNVSTFEGLQEQVREARLVDSAKLPYTDEMHEDYARIRDFVVRCLAYAPSPMLGQ